MRDGMRVLVVDDEQVVLDSVERHLRREGHTVTGVLNAKDAIQVLRAGGADLVITDLMMPGMDGLQLLELVRRSGWDVPVIMITGYATMRTALQALRNGAFDYIAKPFTRAELQGVVARAARQADQGGAAEVGVPARDAVGPDACHHLGGHCWVRVDAAGAATVGLEEAYAATVGVVEEIEMPGKGDFIEQGSVCMRILTQDGRTHTLWSPLSGSVLAVNERLRATPDLAREDPLGEGWLVRIEPGNLTEELRGLSPG